MRAAIIFLTAGIAVALLPDAASAQFKQIDSIGFGKSAAPRTYTAPGGLKAAGSANKGPRLATVAPLTVKECEGLGGKTHVSFSCGRLGGLACATVDAHGVVRTECINK
jgi:hypothetical protein